MDTSKLLELLGTLKQMPRIGWLQCGVTIAGVEDVAQHSFEVSTITMLLADVVRKSGAKLNGDRAIRMAILHDWAEATVADFPYTALKYLSSSDEKRKMERRALEEMFRGVALSSDYLTLWDEYSQKSTTESKLVHAADLLSILVTAVKYRERGLRSKELDDLWNAVNEELAPFVREFPPVEELVRDFGKRFRS